MEEYGDFDKFCNPPGIQLYPPPEDYYKYYPADYYCKNTPEDSYGTNEYTAVPPDYYNYGVQQFPAGNNWEMFPQQEYDPYGSQMGYYEYQGGIERMEEGGDSLESHRRSREENRYCKEKYRRYANNTRERMRVHDINLAFKELGNVCATFGTKTVFQSKLNILKEAGVIIRDLEQRVKSKGVNPKLACLQLREKKNCKAISFMGQDSNYYHEVPPFDLPRLR